MLTKSIFSTFLTLTCFCLFTTTGFSQATKAKHKEKEHSVRGKVADSRAAHAARIRAARARANTATAQPSSSTATDTIPKNRQTRLRPSLRRMPANGTPHRVNAPTTQAGQSGMRANSANELSRSPADTLPDNRQPTMLRIESNGTPNRVDAPSTQAGQSGMQQASAGRITNNAETGPALPLPARQEPVGIFEELLAPPTPEQAGAGLHLEKPETVDKLALAGKSSQDKPRLMDRAKEVVGGWLNGNNR